MVCLVLCCSYVILWRLQEPFKVKSYRSYDVESIETGESRMVWNCYRRWSILQACAGYYQVATYHGLRNHREVCPFWQRYSDMLQYLTEKFWKWSWNTAISSEHVSASVSFAKAQQFVLTYHGLTSLMSLILKTFVLPQAELYHLSSDWEANLNSINQHLTCTISIKAISLIHQLRPWPSFAA